MNVKAYRILPLFSRDKIGASSGKKMYIGVGSAHYPKSRENIGVHFINLLAKENNLKWEDYPNEPYYIVESDRVILAKIKTWETRHAGKSVKRIIENFGIRSMDDVIFVHSDKIKRFGQYTEETGGNFGNNENLENIRSVLDTERFGRIAIGVEPLQTNYKPRVLFPLDFYLSQENLDKGYYLNTLTKDEDRIFNEKVYDPLAKEFYEQYLKQSD